MRSDWSGPEFSLLAWDMATGRVIHRTRLPYRGFAALAKHGTFILQKKSDDALCVWHAWTALEISELRRPASHLRVNALAEDGRYAVFSEAGTLYLWSTDTGRVQDFALHDVDARVASVTFTADGRHLVCIAEEGTELEAIVYRWCMTDGTQRLRRELGCGTTRTSPSDDGEIVGCRVTRPSHDDAVVFLSTSTGREIGCTGELSSLSWLAPVRNSNLFAFGFRENVQFWDPDRATIRGGFPLDHFVFGAEIAADPAGMRIALAAEPSPLVYPYDVNTQRCLVPPIGHTSAVSCAVFTCDSGRLLSTGDDGIRTWNVLDGSEGMTLRGSAVAPLPNREQCAAFEPEARVLSVHGSDGRVRGRVTLDNDRGAYRFRSPISSLVVASPDGQRVVVTCDSEAYVCDVWQQRVLLRLNGHEASVVGAAITPDGGRIVTADAGTDLYVRREGSVRMWDLLRGTELLRVQADPEGIDGLALLPNGTQFVTVGRQGRICLWDLETGHLEREIGQHDASCVVATADGSEVVTTGRDSTLHVWDLSRGRLLRVLENASGPNCACVSPDGKWLATGNRDGTITLYPTSSLAEPDA